MLVVRGGVTLFALSMVQNGNERGAYELPRFDAAWCCGETGVRGGEAGCHFDDEYWDGGLCLGGVLCVLVLKEGC